MTDNRQGMTPSWRLAHPILQGGSAGLHPPQRGGLPDASFFVDKGVSK